MTTVPGLEHLPPLQSGRSAKSRNPAVIDQPSAPKVPAAGASGERSATEQERQFAEHWVVHRNQAQAYKAAYGDGSCSLETARAGGHTVFHRPAVQAEIAALQATAREQSAAVADTAWLLRRYVDIATADPRELIGLRVGCCRYCYGEGHAFQWREREYLDKLEKAEREAAKRQRAKAKAGVARYSGPEPDDVDFPDVAGGFGYNATHPPFPDCPQCHGEGVERFVPRDTDQLSDQALLLYGGVKAKRDGYEIIIADREKALEMVGRILGSFNDKLDLTANVKGLLAVADLAKMDPQEASKKYQDFIAGRLAANAGDPRTTGARAGHGKGFGAADA